MTSSLLNNLQVFPVPGRESAEEAEQREQMEVFAREDALRQEGYAQGFEEGKSASDQAYEEKVQILSEVGEQMIAQMEAIGRQIEESHSRALTSILEASMPHFAKKQTVHEVRAILEEVTHGKLQGDITLKASAEMTEKLKTAFESLSANFTINFEADENELGHGVQMQWEHGGAEVNIENVLERCLALIHGEQEQAV